MDKQYYTYLTCLEITEKALDMLDIKKFLQKNIELYDIFWNIKDYIEDGDGQDVWNVEEYMKQYPSVFDNPPDIFNYMSQDEFMEYCKKRYPEIKWGYEFIERYWVANDGVTG